MMSVAGWRTHQELRLGVDASWPPFEYRDENGRYQGLAADYVRLIQDRLGVKIKLIEPASWTAVLEQAKTNQLDLLPGIMSTPERQGYPRRSHAPISTFPSSYLPTKVARNRATSRTCTG